MFIECGELRAELLILLIYNVGIFFAKILGSRDINQNPLYYLFIFYISHFLAAIPILISKKRTLKLEISNKIEENQNHYLGDYFKKETDNSIFVVQEQINKERRFHTIINFFLIASLYFACYAFFYYYNYIVQTLFYGTIAIISEIFYFSLFDVLILKTNISKHHYFGMFLITVSILALYIILNIQHMKNADIMSDIIIPNILNLFAYCPFCFFLVKSKEYMEKYFISPYVFVFYLGVFGTALLILFEPFTFLIHCEQKVICNDEHFGNIIVGFRKNFTSFGYIISFLLEILTLFLTAIGLWLTVKILSPSHFITTDSIVTFSLNILFDILLENYILVKNIWYYIFSLITIIGCLIYNEIIIIRVFGLEYNTRKEINKRQKQESEDEDNMISDNKKDESEEDFYYSHTYDSMDYRGKTISDN